MNATMPAAHADPRSGIFAAVRAAARPGLFSDPGHIMALDNLLDAFGVARAKPAAVPAGRLGGLSERYESAGRGPGTISSGKGDPGGVSYGTYQLASKTGTVAAFIAAEGAPWASDFAGKAPGSEAFSTAWAAIAQREPAAFGAAQHAFIERTHYRPVVDAVRRNTGFDLDSRHHAVRDATWSCAVQHGKAASILATAVLNADRACADRLASPYYDRELLTAIYAARSDYVRSVAARLAGNQRQTLLSIVANRYPDELKRAREMMA